MNYDYKKNRYQTPQKYNPNETLIDAYISGKAYRQYDTKSRREYDPSQAGLLDVVYPQLYSWLLTGKPSFDTAKDNIAYPQIARFLAQKNMSGIIDRNTMKNVYEAARREQGQLSERVNFEKQPDYEPSEPGGFYEHEPENESEYEPEEDLWAEEDYDEGHYSSDAWGDYDTYLSYYRGIGIFVPSGYVIEIGETNRRWQRDDSYKWRLIIIIEDPNYAQKHEPTVPSFGTHSNYDFTRQFPVVGAYGDEIEYSFRNRRSWSILPHLAFSESVDPDILDRLENAAAKYGDGSDQDFKTIAGRNQDPQGRYDKEGYVETVKKYNIFTPEGRKRWGGF